MATQPSMSCLSRYKEMASFKMESLQKSLAESVPGSSLEQANREFADLTAKYRDVLQREQVQQK
jgi:centrosomal protein CEP290